MEVDLLRLDRSGGVSVRPPSLATATVIIIIIFFFFLVEFRQWVTDILEVDFRAVFAEVKRMHTNRADKSGQCDLLKLIMNKRPHLFGKLVPIWARGSNRFPPNVD
jgi:hypothetical protein